MLYAMCLFGRSQWSVLSSIQKYTDPNANDLPLKLVPHSRSLQTDFGTQGCHLLRSNSFFFSIFFFYFFLASQFLSRYDHLESMARENRVR